MTGPWKMDMRRHRQDFLFSGLFSFLLLIAVSVEDEMKIDAILRCERAKDG
jgi:hypothetical protein